MDRNPQGVPPQNTSERQERLYRMAMVMQMTGLARSTIYKVMGLGKFPRQVRLTDQSVAWRSRDIEDWIASRSSATNSTRSSG